jgi:hypothetical protein
MCAITAASGCNGACCLLRGVGSLIADSGAPLRGQLARRSVRLYPALEGSSGGQRRTRSRYARASTLT